MPGPDRIGDAEQLRRLRLLTDAGLSRLAVPEQLDEILRRLRTLLSADMAAVTLLDGAGHAVPAAAAATGGEFPRSTRSPAAQALTDRIVRARRPVSIGHPCAGLGSLIGVPIFAVGEVVGVLEVGTVQARGFSADDVELLQLAADRAGVADQSRSHRAERSAALALQKGLLPTRLPRIAALRSAARYVPGHEFGVGGDWYDVFTLPSGWVGMVIGDVSGHGLASAVIMGRVRSALRAYTLVTDDPAHALGLLDRKIYQFEAGSLTTALYAMISPDRSTVRVSSAGHLRPVLAAPDRPAALVDMPVDTPLGVGRPGRARHTTVIGLPPGALLLAYTDGLVERRDQVIDVGIDMLVDTVRPDDPDTVCASVLTRFAMAQPTDDIAVLALRRDGCI